MNILVVDDSSISNQILKAKLLKEGYTATLAETPKEAAKLLKDHHFNLLITDLMMPGVNGLELFFWIQEHAPNLPSILISSSLTTEVREMAESAGMVAAIPKPVEMETLLPILYTLENRGVSGKLFNIGINELLEVLMLNPKRRIIELHDKQENTKINLFVDRNQLVHAESLSPNGESVKGEPAFQRVLKIKNGEFKEVTWKNPEETSIQVDFQTLAMNSATLHDENTVIDSHTKSVKSVLVVDKDMSQTLLIKRLITSMGLICLTGNNVEEAKKILGKEAIDLLIYQLNLPDKTGVSLIKDFLENVPLGQLILNSTQKPQEIQTMLSVEGIKCEPQSIYTTPLDIMRFKKHILSLSHVGLQGFLSDINVMDFIQITLRSMEFKLIKIRSEIDNTTGSIYFSPGQFMHAEYEGLSGVEALVKIFKIKRGLFFEQEWETPKAKTLEHMQPHKLMIQGLSNDNLLPHSQYKVSPELLSSIENRLKYQNPGEQFIDKYVNL